MRDPRRIDRILALLRECWTRYPDQRFFQLILNAYKSSKSDPFFVEDDETERMLRDLLTASQMEVPREL